LATHVFALESVDLLPDRETVTYTHPGNRAITCSTRLLNSSTKREVLRLPWDASHIAPDGRLVAAEQVSRDGTTRRLEAFESLTGKQIPFLRPTPELVFVHSVCFSSDNRFLALSGWDGKGYLGEIWDLHAGSRASSFSGVYYRLTFLPNTHILAGFSRDSI